MEQGLPEAAPPPFFCGPAPGAVAQQGVRALEYLPVVVIGAAIIPSAWFIAARAADTENLPHREWSRLVLDD